MCRGQLLKYIPQGIIQAAAREFEVDDKTRVLYSVLGHLAVMVFAQLTHAFSLNDFCSRLRLKRGAVAGFEVTPTAQRCTCGWTPAASCPPAPS